jgi:hypothetical protein
MTRICEAAQKAFDEITADYDTVLLPKILQRLVDETNSTKAEEIERLIDGLRQLIHAADLSVCTHGILRQDAVDALRDHISNAKTLLPENNTNSGVRPNALAAMQISGALMGSHVTFVVFWELPIPQFRRHRGEICFTDEDKIFGGVICGILCDDGIVREADTNTAEGDKRCE